jgi:hypothetical protein
VKGIRCYLAFGSAKSHTTLFPAFRFSELRECTSLNGFGIK